MIYLKSLLSSWNDEEIIQIQISRPLRCLCSGEALDPRGGTHCTGFTQAALVSEVSRAFEERGVTPILETLGPRLTSLTAPPQIAKSPSAVEGCCHSNSWFTRYLPPTERRACLNPH